MSSESVGCMMKSTIIHNYSGIRIKSTPLDRKKLLTLSKVDFIQFQGRKPRVLLKIGVALGASSLLVKISVNY